MELSGLILMGGRNSRMNGQKKAFLTYEGMPFYQRIANQLPVDGTIYLSVENKANYEALPYPLIEDLYEGIGPISGIYSTLMTCQTKALLTTPCDTPNVSRELFHELIAFWRMEQKPVLLSEGERLNPLIGIYTKDCMKALHSMIQKGDYKMSHLLDHYTCKVVSLSSLGLDQKQVFNVNTPDEYSMLP